MLTDGDEDVASSTRVMPLACVDHSLSRSTAAEEALSFTEFRPSTTTTGLWLHDADEDDDEERSSDSIDSATLAVTAAAADDDDDDDAAIESKEEEEEEDGGGGGEVRCESSGAETSWARIE